MITKLTERDHIILRPAMYIGATDKTQVQDFILQDSTIDFVDVEYVPGLIKIINEIIDNCVDVAIKSKFTSSTLIQVKMDSKSIEVKDNGTGIPIEKNSEGIYMPELAWGHARAGSNFTDDANRTQIGMNGVGSFATNCFSKKFVGKTDDGKKSFIITFTDNAGKSGFKTGASTEQGTIVKFFPDLEKFGLTEIDEVHMNIIKQRLMNLSMSYPKISFKFNGKKINISSFKKYISMFSEDAVIHESDCGKYKFAFAPNPHDDFKQFTYVNGLKIPEGGTHVDNITLHTILRLRDKIKKKYKNIKPGDIKNKMSFIGFFTDMKNTKFNSQSKEKITNSATEVTAYLGDIDYDKIAAQLYKCKPFIDPITEVYRIKEELKRRQELNKLKKGSKKIKSEKYFPSIGDRKRLVIAEGDSAIGGLAPVMGRKENGFFALKGKPLNAIQATSSKFVANKELSELFKIIQQEGYDEIVIATDSDLDGIHIRGLLIGFIHRYLPDFRSRIGILNTPVKYVHKSDKPTRWVYDLNDDLQPKSGEKFKYVKGLGTWPVKHLKLIIEMEGLDKMITTIDFDDDDIIKDWLGPDSEARKDFIQDNEFNIAKL